MSEVQLKTLMDMGFSKERAEKALQVTNFAGVEPAMEWLLAHGDEVTTASTHNVPPSVQESNLAALASGGGGETAAGSGGSAATSSETVEAAVAKSLKCDDCSKLFKDQTEMQYHAAKTGHSSFSESTEEKKPLTEEEKKLQLALIEEKLKQKRAERQMQERADELEREKSRIKSGKDMTEARKKMEELEMAKILEQRKREKAEEKAARERVKAQIEADKLARKAKLNAELGVSKSSTLMTGGPSPSNVNSALITNTNSIIETPKKEYTDTKIQVRLHDGSVLTETFSVKEQLSAVRTYIQVQQGTDFGFDLMTSFPRKVFIDEDYDKPLEILGLVPTAVIIVTKKK